MHCIKHLCIIPSKCVNLIKFSVEDTSALVPSISISQKECSYEQVILSIISYLKVGWLLAVLTNIRPIMHDLPDLKVVAKENWEELVNCSSAESTVKYPISLACWAMTHWKEVPSMPFRTLLMVNELSCRSKVYTGADIRSLKLYSDPLIIQNAIKTLFVVLQLNLTVSPSMAVTFLGFRIKKLSISGTSPYY